MKLAIAVAAALTVFSIAGAEAAAKPEAVGLSPERLELRAAPRRRAHGPDA